MAENAEIAHLNQSIAQTQYRVGGIIWNESCGITFFDISLDCFSAECICVRSRQDLSPYSLVLN
jgi:hypothetical protein